jgi:hypothetical protein
MEQQIDARVSEVGAREGIAGEPRYGCVSHAGVTQGYVPAHRSRSAA